MKQKYTSKDTSLNQVAAIYKKYHFPTGAKVLDYGGGKYDTAADYMKTKAVFVGVYDPYNRTPEHNAAVLELFSTPEYVVCSNVLNVVAEDDVIDEILENLASYGATVLITVYEGDRSGIGRATSKGYQRNMKTADYAGMIRKHFGTVIRKNGIYECYR